MKQESTSFSGTYPSLLVKDSLLQTVEILHSTSVSIFDCLHIYFLRKSALLPKKQDNNCLKRKKHNIMSIGFYFNPWKKK